LKLSVIIPTYNPSEPSLARVLEALHRQTLAHDQWEALLVNNASTRFPNCSFFARHAPPNLRVITESQLGLTAARACGLSAAKGDGAVLVDDDNELSADYLERALKLLENHPEVGALGGRIDLEFASPPPAWISEFHNLLAEQNYGEVPLISTPIAPDRCATLTWPSYAPIGAGMVLRREAWEAWLAFLDASPTALSDRKGTQLTSSGDNELILVILKAGWQVGYFPSLTLTHLIPQSRLAPNYLARLNFGCSSGFIQALRRHGACPWAPIPRWTLPLRVARAWFRCRAWRGPANRIRWRGLVGHFTARVR